MKTIAIFLDGTWNKPETQTNVRLAFQALAFDSNSTDSLKRFRFNKDHSGQEHAEEGHILGIEFSRRRRGGAGSPMYGPVPMSRMF